jgi:hypothetical protein
MQGILNSPEAQAARGEAPMTEIDDEAPDSAVVEQEVEEEIPDFPDEDEEADEEGEAEDESADEEAEEDEQPPDDEEGEAEEEPDALQEEEFYLARYRTKEEGERALREHYLYGQEKARLAAEWEREAVEWKARAEERERRSAPAQYETWLEQQMETDPEAGVYTAIQWAIDANDPSYLTDYTDRWGQDDPYRAATVRLDAMQALYQAQAQQAQPQAQPQPQNEMESNAAQLLAYQEAIEERPEIANTLGEVSDTLKSNPSLLRAWASDDPAWAKQALFDAYKISTASRGPRKIRKSDMEQVARDKRAATVATGDGAPERRPSSPELTAMEESILAGADMLGLKRRDQ